MAAASDIEAIVARMYVLNFNSHLPGYWFGATIKLYQEENLFLLLCVSCVRRTRRIRCSHSFNAFSLPCFVLNSDIEGFTKEEQ